MNLLTALIVSLVLVPSGGEPDPPFWPAEPVFSIGGSQDPETVLHEVREVAVDGDGTLHLLQFGEPRVWRFDREGTALEAVGQEGEGPGEFRSPSTLGWARDTLWVGDPALDRITLFDGDDFARTLQVSHSLPGHTAPVLALRILGDGDLQGTPIPEAGPPQADSLPLLRISRDGELRDTLFVVAPGQTSMSIEAPGVGIRTLQPFATGDLHGFDLRGEWGVRVGWTDHCPGNTASITGATVQTRTGRVEEWSLELASGPLSEARVEAAYAEVLDRLREAALAHPGAGFEESRARRAIEEALVRPDCSPPVTDLHVDASGRSWLRGVEPTEGDEVRWWILAPEGEVLGWTRLPRSLEVHSVEEGVWGVKEDDLGVERIVGYRVTPERR